MNIFFTLFHWDIIWIPLSPPLWSISSGGFQELVSISTWLQCNWIPSSLAVLLEALVLFLAMKLPVVDTQYKQCQVNDIGKLSRAVRAHRGAGPERVFSPSASAFQIQAYLSSKAPCLGNRLPNSQFCGNTGEGKGTEQQNSPSKNTMSLRIAGRPRISSRCYHCLSWDMKSLQWGRVWPGEGIHPWRESSLGALAECFNFPHWFLLDVLRPSTWWWCLCLLPFILYLEAPCKEILFHWDSIRNSSCLPVWDFPRAFLLDALSIWLDSFILSPTYYYLFFYSGCYILNKLTHIIDHSLNYTEQMEPYIMWFFPICSLTQHSLSIT